MPDILKNDLGQMDWTKFFMAIAMAALFFFQGMSHVNISTTKEIQAKHAVEIKEVVTKEAILEMIIEQMQKGK